MASISGERTSSPIVSSSRWAVRLLPAVEIARGLRNALLLSLSSLNVAGAGTDMSRKHVTSHSDVVPKGSNNSSDISVSFGVSIEYR
jgi:hypothetical protein